MIYALWHIDSNNLVGDYRSQEEALRVVRNALELHGRDAIVRLALTVEDQTGDVSPLAHGQALVDLALGEEQPLRPAR